MTNATANATTTIAPHDYVNIEGLRIFADDACEGCGAWTPDLLTFQDAPDAATLLFCPPCGGVNLDDPMTQSAVALAHKLNNAGNRIMG